MTANCKRSFTLIALSLGLIAARAHVPHDIIYSLGVSPDYANDGLVFSSSMQFGEAHLVSHNRGETFSESHAGMRRTLVTGHVFSPDFKRDGTVYLTSRNGYYKSTDRGRNWVKQSAFADEAILSLCLSKDGSIYLLTKTGLHLVPSNGGKVRTLKSFGEATFGKLELRGQRLFVHRVHFPAVKKVKGMEKVDYDSGSVQVLDLKSGKWSELAEHFTSAIIADFDVSKDGSSIAVSLKDGGVLLSGDAGENWQEVHRRPSGFVCKVRFSPHYATDGTIACGSSEGFIRLSTDRGKTWKLRSDGLSRWVHHVNILINHLEFSPDYQNDKTIFLGKTSGFHKTTDAGKTWRHVNVWNTKWGYFVLPAPGKDAKDVFSATYNSGISRSHDGGKSWASANIGISSAFANGMQLSPNYAEDKTLFVVDIGSGLYRSRDAGRTWSGVKELDLSKHYDQPVLYRKLGISSRFKDDGLMFLFTVPRKILGLAEKHVWKYNDQTKELKQVTIGRSANYINGFAFTPKDSPRKRMFAATARGLFRSDDQGESWQVCKSGNFSKVIVSPDASANGLIYAMDGGGRIHASTDAGETFRFVRFTLPGGSIDNLTFSPSFVSDRTLYATTFGEGLFRSQDAGKSWSYFALRGKHLFSGPSFSPNYARDQTMFAPAVDGIYRSADGGKEWNNVLQWTQFLPKVPFLILRDPSGQQIPLTYNVPEDMKCYGVHDAEAVGKIFEPLGNRSRKLKSPKAYLASYYKFNVDAGYAIEVNFYGDAIEYKCIKGPGNGIVDIVLDGEPHGQLDLYAAKEFFDVTGFRKDRLKHGLHTLRIISTGKKNENSHGTAMTFNAANVRN
jgi:photosystem II stability/assembly factor-like uncharacterized protein